MQVRSKSYVVYYCYMSVSYLLQGNVLKFSLAMYSNKNVECWKLSLCQDCLVPFAKENSLLHSYVLTIC